LTDYLEKYHEFPHQRERRRFVRKQVSIPAHVRSTDSDKSEREAVILDISLSGLCVSVPKESMPEIYEGAEKSTFETLFVLPRKEKSIRMVCRPQRVVPVNDNVHVGASFVDSDFANYQQLQQYLA
jgi:c-di-GMP-binding flagellar brake protein YcgR